MTHSGQAYAAVSCPATVMANVAKPSPCWAGDCFGREGRSLAMTHSGQAYVAVSCPTTVMARFDYTAGRRHSKRK